MTRVAALLVTHNSSHVIAPTLASVLQQSRVPDLLIAIDDNSTDGTLNDLRESGFSTMQSTSTSLVPETRIAQNFVQGVRTAISHGADIVVLGDHDDVWHLNRVEHQAKLLASQESTAMVASDGFLIDEFGAAVPGTLRQTFPVPSDLMTLPPRKQWSFALRHSLATGGASAIRPSTLTDWSVPPRWLHDRWWSLEALRHKALMIDTTPVIDYRISVNQRVGLETAGQESAVRWSRNKVKTLGVTSRRLGNLTRLIRS